MWILFSETFLSLCRQARLQLLNRGLPWKVIMRAESQNPVLPWKGANKTRSIWFFLLHPFPLPCKKETTVSHTQKGVVYFMKLDSSPFP